MTSSGRRLRRCCGSRQRPGPWSRRRPARALRSRRRGRRWSLQCRRAPGGLPSPARLRARPSREEGWEGWEGWVRLERRAARPSALPYGAGAAAVEGSALDSQLQRRHGGTSRHPGVQRSRGWSRTRHVEHGTGSAAQRRKRRTVDFQERITLLEDNLVRCTHAKRQAKCRARHTAFARRLGCLTYTFHSSGDISHSSRWGDLATP